MSTATTTTAETGAPGTAPLLVARGIGRVFRTPAGDVAACRDVDVTLHPGELLVVAGPSGSGKTTLLGVLGTLDRPTSGTVEVDGADVTTLGAAELAALRRRRFGFVFQSFGLLDDLTAAENVEVPLRLRRTAPAERARRVAQALDLVGLPDKARQRVDELSGGQRQRVGIARALVAEPALLVADEPTSQLDSENAAVVIDLITALVRERGIAAVVATHEPGFVERGDHVLRLRDGRPTPT